MSTPRTRLEWRIDPPEPAEDGVGVEVEISAIDDYGHTTIAVVNDDNRGWMDVARLIAAAPDMLAALEHARDNCIGHPDQMIDEAIAKAKGDDA